MMQIRLTMTSAELVAERARSNSRDAMVVREDARAMGATTALRPGGTRRPRVSQQASPCLVTRADGSQYVIASKQVTRTIARKQVASLPAHRITAADLRPIMDSNH